MQNHESLRDFPHEVGVEVQKAVIAGGRNRGEEIIGNYQEHVRSQFRAQGIDIDSFVPEIGQHIRRSDVLRQVLRVLEFDRANTSIGSDGVPKAASGFAPYGYLLVESPILNQPARLPITHRVDFQLASSVFDNPEWRRCAELLVTYAPKRSVFRSVLHVLHYVICRRGTLERYYEFDDNLHMAKPAVEKLFGKLRYLNWAPVQLADWE